MPLASVPAELDVQLDVLINGEPAHVIGAFTLLDGTRLAATRSELAQLGIRIPGTGPAEERIELASVKSLAYRFDPIRQSVDFRVANDLRLARTFDASPMPERITAEASNGMVVNYTAFAEGSHDMKASRTTVNGGSLSLDGRAFSKYGTLSQSGIIGTTTFADATALRLDTVLSYADEDHARSFRGGDIITGSLSWTRPIRMGGIQVQRNFALRPDLITMPLPSVAGSAAVPSTIDIYVNNVKTYSQDLGSGPFEIGNLPVVTGSGAARIVITDATGRKTEQESDFYTSPNLLRKGLYDYSIDAGVARRGYGTKSFDYDDKPLASAGLRYGLNDHLTGEAHAEISTSLVNGGLGATTGIGGLGEFNAAVAASDYKGGAGLMTFAGWDTEFGRLSLNASTRRTFGDYADLASITGDNSPVPASGAANAKAIDQLSLAYGFPAYDAGIGLSLIHLEDANGDHSFITSGSVSKSFDNSLSVYASAFWQTGENESYGAFAGFSMPLGKKLTSSASASLNNGIVTGAASLSRPLDGQPGSYGWQVSHGEGQSSFTTANAAYRGNKALLQAQAWQNGDDVGASLSADGSIVVAGGGLFLGNRIDQSFAIVDAGAPDVPVKLENRPVGKTGRSGKMLVTGLNAYQKNKISIDIENLPVTADIPKTETYAVPKMDSGMIVDFGIKPDQGAAIVTVTDSDGKFLPVGTAVSLAGGGESFVVGFDGELYLTGLSAENTFEATANSVVCSGTFAFQPKPGEQQIIGPVKCS